MEFIKCPYCGQEQLKSSGQTVCIKCRHVINQDVQGKKLETKSIAAQKAPMQSNVIIVACPTCGQKLKSAAGSTALCPKCKTKIKFGSASNTVLEAKPIKKESRKSNWKIPLISIAGVAVVCIVAGFFVNRYYEEQVYLKNIQTVLSCAEESYTASESISGLAGAVWNDAVFRNERDGTSQYVYRGGYHHDFNTALQYYYEDESVQSAVLFAKIYAGFADVGLKNAGEPPAKYKDLQEKAITLTDSVSKFYDLASSPAGLSLNEYGTRRTELLSDCETAYRVLDGAATEPNEDFINVIDKIMFWKNDEDDDIEEEANSDNNLLSSEPDTEPVEQEYTFSNPGKDIDRLKRIINPLYDYEQASKDALDEFHAKIF